MIAYIRELFRYRELLVNIALREVKVRYKQTILGVVWAVIQPLSMMIVFTIVFSKFGRIPSDGVPYPIFSYSGLLPWTFFATSLSFAIPSLVANTGILTKVYFPREIFPIACVAASFIDFAIASIIFAGLMIFYRVTITANALYIVPIFLVQVIFTLGVSLFASALNVFYRDIRYALPLGIQLWMFITPIVYPVSMVPERYRPLYMLNPMAGIIDGYRRVIIGGTNPQFGYLVLAAIMATIIFYISYKYFKYVESAFADVI